MDKKYQIFVSSTFSDLQVERQAVSKAILDLGHIPAGMEMFPAADLEQMEYIRKVIDECDYYVLIIAARYGSVDDMGISYTEREYQYAKESGKTVIALLHKNMDVIPQGNTDKDDAKRKKLEEFVQDVSQGRIVRFWSNSDELSAAAIISLTKSISMFPQVGWVRADTVANAEALQEIVSIRSENDKLKKQLSQIKSQLQPKFEDAASLDASLKISYTYKYAGFRRVENGSRTINYADFLKWIASSLHNPSTLIGVKAGLSKALKDRGGASGDTITVVDSEVEDAVMHLVATGYVKMWQSKGANGRAVTAYQMTEKGTSFWMEHSYVKKGEEM